MPRCRRTPAVITTPWFDYPAWNPLFVALMRFDPESLPAKCRNLLFLWCFESGPVFLLMLLRSNGFRSSTTSR
jgi:hypothetical protein